MGARESRSHTQQEADDDGGTTSQDYYAILEVDENANADEIRVSSFALPGRGLVVRRLMAIGWLAAWLGLIVHSSQTAFVPTSCAHPSSRQESRRPRRCDPTLRCIAASV